MNFWEFFLNVWNKSLHWIHINSLVIETDDNEERCFTKFLTDGSTISVNYKVLGIQENNFVSRLVDVKGDDIYKITGNKH